MASYILIFIGVVLVLYGFIYGIMKREYTGFKLSRTPREKHFKKPVGATAKKEALIDAFITIIVGILFIILGLR